MKTHTLQVRITDKQKKALEARAEQLTKNLGDRVTTSSLIRKLINKYVAGAAVLLVLLSGCGSSVHCYKDPSGEKLSTCESQN